MVRRVYIIPLSGSQEAAQLNSERIRVGNIFNADRQKVILTQNTAAGESTMDVLVNVDTFGDLSNSANRVTRLSTSATAPLTSVTQSPADNSTKVATTAYVDAAVVGPSVTLSEVLINGNDTGASTIAMGSAGGTGSELKYTDAGIKGFVSSSYYPQSTGTLFYTEAYSSTNKFGAQVWVEQWATGSIAYLLTYDNNINKSTYIAIEPTASGSIVYSNVALYQGLKYYADYSANYTTRSLVDKAYVDAAVSGAGNLSTVLTAGNDATGQEIINLLAISTTVTTYQNGIYFNPNGKVSQLYTTNSASADDVSIFGSVETANLPTVVSKVTYSGGTTQTEIKTLSYLITSTAIGFTGAVYGADYSSSYTTRSLIDKGYAAATFAPIASSNPMSTLGDIIYGGVAGAMTRLPGNSTNSQLFLASTGAAGSALAPSWQPIPALGVLVYYWTETASDIATYYKMLGTNYTSTNDIPTVGVTNGQLLATFATDANNPNRTFIPDGQYSCHIHAAKVGGTKDAQLYAEIWEVNAAGVDIAKIVTLGTSVVLTGVSAEYLIATSLASNYVLTSTASRIITKVYATISGGGSAPDITIYMSPTADSRTNLPAPIVDITNYVPYTGATSGLNLGSQTLTTSGAVSLTGTTNNLGTITTGIWNGTAIGAIYGGTGQTTVTAGDLLYGSAANTWSKLAGVAAGKFLQAGGIGVAPAWSTATLPATATGTGTILIADGTNWVASTNTYPNTTPITQIIYGSAANVLGSHANFNFDNTNYSLGIGRANSAPTTYVIDAYKSANTSCDIVVTNGTSGTGAFSRFVAVNSSGTSYGMGMLSAGYTTNGILVGDRGFLQCSSTSGLAILSQGAGSSIYFAAAGTTAQFAISSTLISSTIKATFGTAVLSGLMLQANGAAETTFTSNPSTLGVFTNNALAVNMGGGISFGGVYTGSTQTPFAYIGGLKETATSGQYGGYLLFGTRTDGSGGTTMEKMRLSSVGNLSIGGTAVRGTTVGTNTLQIFNGTAPVGTLTNGFSIYSASGNAYYANSAGKIVNLGYDTTTSTSNTVTFTSAHYGLAYLWSPTGTATATLPANGAAAGSWFDVIVLTDQTTTISAATVDTLITVNDVTADSIAFSTAGSKIGSMVRFISNGTVWIAINLGSTTMTVAT